MSNQPTIYYLPGHGGLISKGLGEGLASRGWAVKGRETVGDFRALSFQQKIDLIAQDLENLFWHDNAHVIAVSFGAYLFLHAQAQLAPYIGKVLLISPIVGEFSNEQIGMGFIPPRSKRLKELALSKQYPAPINCHIHVGSEDWQSNPHNVTEFAELVGIPVTMVPQAGHTLGKAYVSGLLDRW
jgi:alpha-beta hydrolase superfamily lysophospholipase